MILVISISPQCCSGGGVPSTIWARQFPLFYLSCFEMKYEKTMISQNEGAPCGQSLPGEHSLVSPAHHHHLENHSAAGADRREAQLSPRQRGRLCQQADGEGRDPLDQLGLPANLPHQGVLRH